jgi:hypothetical protein
LVSLVWALFGVRICPSCQPLSGLAFKIDAN